MTTPKNLGLRNRLNLGELTQAKSDNDIRTPLTRRLAATEKRLWLIRHSRGRIPSGRPQLRSLDRDGRCVVGTPE
jgi:hypothetical protein